jgi:hypothetical protein
MFAFVDFGREGIPILLGVSFAFVCLVFLGMWMFRSIELKLFFLGIITGLLAVFCEGILGGSGANFQVPGGQGAIAVGSDAPRILGRIALVLVLGGVGVTLIGRCVVAPITSAKEDAIHGNPM